ncbi:MAG: four helix bundle protein [Chloroflexi bacterium]|nr:four helix bundle protein [Chloroflexota bacterium]
MDEATFRRRTMNLGLEAIRLVDTLPPGMASQVIGRQLLRSATSVGANYRAACRARSVPDMVSKLGIVEEEADESAYWLEVLVRAGHLDSARASPLLQEADEITRMVVASRKTLKDRPPIANRKSTIENQK